MDYDAEGLILVTNNGEIAQLISHPKNHIWKSYFVKIKGIIKKDELRRLKRGPIIVGNKRQPLKAKILQIVNDKTWLEISLQEGVNRHIKKMFQKTDKRVLEIKRFQIANIHLGEIKPGEFRLLGRKEIKRFWKFSKQAAK